MATLQAKKTTVSFKPKTLEQLNQLEKKMQYRRSTLIALAVDDFCKKNNIKEEANSNA